MKQRKEEVGKTYGRLKVIAFAEIDKQKRARWLCRCDCGKETIVTGNSLRKGKVSSCGCARKSAYYSKIYNKWEWNWGVNE